MSSGIVLTTPVSAGYARHSPRTASSHVAQALRALLDASGLRKDHIDGLAVSSFTLAPEPVSALSRSLGMSLRWLESVPFGGASGVIALRRAALAVQAGHARIVACIGADTHPQNGFAQLVEQFSSFAQDAVFPYGAGGPNMPFAHLTRGYMDATGATREDFGRLCVTQRRHAALTPHALLGREITLAEYLASPPIVEPLHRLDCVMPCAGADAFLVMSDARARELGLPRAHLRASIEHHNAHAEDAVALRGGWALEREQLYAQAGVGPADVQVLATYDDYPVVVLLQLEGLGFCGAGEGPDFIRRTDLSLAGTLPHNTSGGMLGCGQAGAAGGCLGLVEVLRQLTGQGGRRQLARVRIGLASGYGMAVYDRCLSTGAALLEAAHG